MKEYIYKLVADANIPFYIGRTNDLTRREREHRYNAKRGDSETKYQAIREFDAAGITWGLELIAEVTDVTQPYEDFYVYEALCDGHWLANMKMGDAQRAAEEQEAEGKMRERKTRYSSPQAFLDARQQEIAEARARAATARLNSMAAAKERRDERADPWRTLFDLEKPAERFMSPWMRAKMAEKNKGHVHRGPQQA